MSNIIYTTKQLQALGWFFGKDRNGKFYACNDYFTETTSTSLTLRKRISKIINNNL